MQMLRLAWRNIGRNRRRSLLSGAAITVATMSIVMLFSYLAGMKANISGNLIDFYNGEVRVRNAEYGHYEHLQPIHLAVEGVTEIVERIEADAITRAAAPRLNVAGGVFRDEERRGVMVVGIDPQREASYSNVPAYVDRGDYSALSRWAADDSAARVVPAAVGGRLAARLGVDLGDRFTVLARTALRGTNALTFEVAAVLRLPVAQMNDTMLFVPLSAAQRLAQLPDAASEVLVKLNNGVKAAEAEAAIRTAVGGESTTPGTSDPLEVAHWTNIKSSYSFIEMAEAIYLFVAFFFFILASTVIVNTTMMVVFERKREIGTLSAMGMETSHILGLFFLEAAIIAALAAIVGVVAGAGVAGYFGRVGIDLTEALSGMDFELNPIIHPIVNARSTIGVFFFAFAVSVAAAFLPTLRITRMRPVDALRDE